MNIIIEDKLYDIIVTKKNNKRTYIRVKDGKIIVTTNYFVSNTSIFKLINDNKDSIIKMINIDKKKQDKKENFYYFGTQYDVIYGFNSFDISDNKIYVKDKKTLDKEILNNIKKKYNERLLYWYNKFTENIPEPSLTIRKMTTRWGVCNTKTHKITLNYELSKYPECCLDYVIVHELSHLIYPNHSTDFWSVVSKYYPKYKECKKILKE